MTRYLLLAAAFCFLSADSAIAQDDRPETEDPVHDELREVRDGFLEAFEQRDVDEMLDHMTDNVVVTVQDAEFLRGHDEVRDFHNRMSEGDDREVESLETKFEVDDLSILHGDDTAIAFGSMNDHFKLSRGIEFDLHSRWTATLVKDGDRWRVAAFHVSTNMFDNGVSNLMTRWTAIKTGGIAAIAGLACGVLAMAWWKRSKT